MKQFVMILAVTLAVFSSAVAQERARVKGSAQSESQTQAETSQTGTLAAGTQLSAELLATLDARKAKPGDEFKLRTLKPMMVGGKQAVAKGAVLTGHVVEASRAEGREGVSQLKLSFDQLRNKGLTVPFSATIEQITQTAINHQTQMDEMGASSGTSGTASTRTTGGANSGLLGGATGAVGSAVGGVVGATTGAVGTRTTAVGNTVGGVAGATQQTVGSVVAVSAETINSTTANARGLIAITSSATGEANGSSTLSLTGRNVKVEKGAIFLLRTDKALNLAANQ